MKIIKLIIFILFVSCNTNFKEEFNGISNLKLKVNSIKINQTNQNDIVSIIGPPIIKDVFDKNIWSYYETKSRINIFGTKKIIINDVLVLKFNKLGLLVDYIIYDINSMKDLKFDQEMTKSRSVEESLAKAIMSSTRKRFDLLNKKNSQLEESNGQ